MNTEQLARSLKKKTPPATVYLVEGEEGALVDRAVEMIKTRVLSEAQSPEFALSRLDGRTASADEVETAARTASLFGGRRAVILRDAHLLKSAEQKKLVGYLQAPVSTTTLVIVIRGVGTDSRNPKHGKAATVARKYKKAVESGGGQIVSCPRPRTRDLPRLAEEVLSEQGLRASRNGLYALTDAVGEDLGALIQAVDKLALYLGDGEVVQEQHVAEVVADTRSQSVFALTDAVGEGAKDRALRVLGTMIRDGESPLAIISHLTRHMRNLARVSALQKKGENVGSIQKALGLHPFVVKKCLLQSRRFSQKALSSGIQALAQADVDIKSGRLPDDMQLQKLVLTLCGERRG